MKKALVLGGTGPTGPLIIEGLFERGYEVTIMHSGQHEATFSQPVEDIHADVHFEDSLREALGNRTFDFVLAAYGRLRITADVMAGRCDRFISIGGIPAIWFDEDRLAAGVQFGPDDPNRERDKFYWDMYRSEQIVLAHHRAGDYCGTHFRYPILYGPRQITSREWCLVRRIVDGRRQLIIADGGIKLESRCYVDHAAHIILLALDKPDASGGNIYFAGDDRVYTVKERAEIVAKALGHEWEFIDLPFELARPAHAHQRGQAHRLASTAKIQTDLGYHDLIPPAEALAITARWLVDNQPQRGGELERQLGDHFDYEREDAIIRAYRSFKDAVDAIGHPPYVDVHPYRHPKKHDEGWNPPAERRHFRLV